MNKMKIQLTNQLDDAKRLCDDEAKERQSLLGRYRNLEHEYDGTNVVYEEELNSKQDAARQCQKAEDEANHWRRKVGASFVLCSFFFCAAFLDSAFPISHALPAGRWADGRCFLKKENVEYAFEKGGNNVRLHKGREKRVNRRIEI